MKTLTINSAKGGVGKTSLSLGIALILAEHGHRTLLLDLDCQGCATSHLAQDYSDDFTIRQVLLGEKELRDILISPNENLSLAPSQLQLQNIEAEIEDVNPIYKLYEVLEEIEQEYDFCIIDTAPNSNSLLTHSAFVASDYIIIPAICEAFPILALDLTFQELGKVVKAQKYINKSLQNSLIVPTFFEERRQVTDAFYSALKQGYAENLADIVIHRSVEVSKTFSTLGARLKPGMRAYDEYVSVIGQVLGIEVF